MLESKTKAFSTVWVVIITAGVTIIIMGAIVLIWYLMGRVDDLEKKSPSQTKTVTTAKTAAAKAVTPSETAVKAGENFLKAIFDTFPGSSVDLTKAKKYLSSDLKSKVNDTKESYWDLHGYIHSGPCSASVSEIEKTNTTATVEVSTEWGEKCYVGVEEPYYRYKMSVANGQWIIDEIEQLKPANENTEMVPRDF